MTKKNIVQVAGFSVLAVAAVFAGRASVKFSGATNLFVSTTGGGCLQITSAAVAKFSTVGTNQATIKTSAATANTRKVWQTACNTITGKRVYFKG